MWTVAKCGIQKMVNSVGDREDGEMAIYERAVDKIGKLENK